MGGEPSFTQECGADGSKKQVSHLCSISLWTWFVMDDPDLVGGVTPPLTLLWENTHLTRKD